MVKQARTWGSAEKPWDGTCAVGADGWPSQGSFGNVFVTSSSDPHAPTLLGTWLMSWEGWAAPTNLPHGQTVENLSYDAATDTTTAALVVATADSPFIMFGFVNASTVLGGLGIKGLKIVQPGYSLEQADDFSAPLLALLGRVDVLRFMDWAHTNGNLITSWANRTTEAAVSYAPDGTEVPWEVIFRLANTLEKDAWINIPAHADADYVTQLASLAASLLNPNLNLYLEFSNEVRGNVSNYVGAPLMKTSRPQPLPHPSGVELVRAPYNHSPKIATPLTQTQSKP